MARRFRERLRAVLREPLLHFLVLGALVYAASAVLQPAARTGGRGIEVTRADIAHIQALYAQQWGAPPDASDMPRLLDSYVRSEILFREGASLGLEADDSVVRNRVVQKMEFLLQGLSASQPSDSEIEAYFKAHEDAYRVPEQLSFAQIYFSPSLRGDHAEADALAALADLKAVHTDTGRGDPFMLDNDPSSRSQADIERDFGPGFAASTFALPAGSWQGPVRSTLGFHLVEVLERKPARIPAFAEIRDRVHDDLVAERLQAANEAAYARVRAKYQVKIDPGALKDAGGAVAAQ